MADCVTFKPDVAELRACAMLMTPFSCRTHFAGRRDAYRSVFRRSWTISLLVLITRVLAE